MKLERLIPIVHFLEGFQRIRMFSEVGAHLTRAPLGLVQPLPSAGGGGGA